MVHCVKKRRTFKFLTATLLIVISLFLSINAQAQYGKEWEEKLRVASEYYQQADMRLYFNSWDDLYVEPPLLPCSEPYPCTPEVDAVYRQAKKIDDLEGFLASFKKDRKLAVIKISTRFRGQIEEIETIFQKHGFRKLVFLAETSIGDVVKKIVEYSHEQLN